jgi:hypothetical protein
MPTFKNQAELLKEGDSLFTALSANQADLNHLNGSREKLEGMLEQMREALAQQSALTASKQEVSKQVEQLFRNGAKLITFLRKGVAEHYGSENEKVVEFGLQPFRGRRRLVAPVTPPPPAVE